MAKQKSFSLLSFLMPVLLVGATLTVVAAVTVGIWKIPQSQVGSAPLKQEEKNRIDAETAARLALIQGAGGLLLFGTAAISFLNLRATQRNVEIAESKQVTDRFSKAVEMLGSENSIHIRGGIAALERIANDAKDSDHDSWQVMEVLTAYVRERTKQTSQHEQASPYVLPTDIQAVLTVIQRRKHYYGYGETHGLDLSRTNLQEANLQKAKLQRANLFVANLQEAKLQGANLQGANLQGVNLFGAYLQGAHLQKANLLAAELQMADFFEAHLQGADLQGADLQGARLEGARLERACLKGARNLTWKQLKRAKSYKNAQLPDYLIQNQPSSEQQSL